MQTQKSTIVALMNELEFLDYCASMCTTPRAGFTPEQIARLWRLAGPE